MATKAIQVPEIRTPYNYDRDAASVDTGLVCQDKSLTKQSEMEACDINVIMRKFGHGDLPNKYVSPQFGDFSQVNDYHTALNAVAVAHEEFDALPAAIRAKFQNDPYELLTYLNDSGNRDEAVKLGLIPPPPPVVPAPSAPAKPDVGVSGAPAPDAKPVAS